MLAVHAVAGQGESGSCHIDTMLCMICQARERQRRLAEREAKCRAVTEAESRLDSQRRDLQSQQQDLRDKEAAVEALMAAANKSRSEAEALLLSHKVRACQGRLLDRVPSALVPSPLFTCI